MSSWYFKSDENEYGPYSLDELIFLKNQGKLAPGAQVKNSKDSVWLRADSVRELFSKERLTRSKINLSSLLEPRAALQQSSTSSEIVEFIDETTNETKIPPLPVTNRNRRHTKIIISMLSGGLLLLLCMLLMLFLWEDPTQPETVASSPASQLQEAGTAEGQSPEGNGATGNSMPSIAESAQSQKSKVDPNPEAETPESISQETSLESKPPEKQNGTTNKEPPASGLLTASRLSVASPGNENITGNNQEINKRLEREGAKTGDVQISLIWNNRNDLDLHVLCPTGERISFDHKHSADGGELDVDMNVRGESLQPVENIYWPPRSMRKGIYKVFVHHYSRHGSPDPTKYTVRIMVGGKSRQFSGTLNYGDPPVLIDNLSR